MKHEALCSLSLRERAGVRGSWLRSGEPPELLARSHASASAAPEDPLTPTLSQREREKPRPSP